MSKVYRTAKGQQIDLGALTIRHEDVRAVGNMNVNARGDVIDSENKKIRSRNEQVNSHYRKQINSNVVEDVPVVSSKHQVQKSAIVEQAVEKAVDQEKENTPLKELDNFKNKGGLAAAIARAREIKQEPLKTPRQQQREKPGVKKI